jgi:lauroyl/myristoyl acyltransferase
MRFLFGLANRVGGLAQSLGITGPAPHEVGAVFSGMSPARQQEVARAIAGRRFANAMLRLVLERVGTDAFARRVRCEGEEHLLDLTRRRQPVLLVPWHCGPLHAISPALIKLGVPALVMRARAPRFGPGRGIEYLYPGHYDDAARARVLKRGVEWLRAGGAMVMLTGLPTPPFERLPGPYRLFGRAVQLLMGPAALARLGAAQIIPVTPRWVEGEIVVRFAAPLALPAKGPERGTEAEFDREVLGLLAAWWERYLREHPEELWLFSLREIARSPYPAAASE